MSNTMHEYRGYVFAIGSEADDGMYSVDYPDVPDIITSGATLAEAFANACEALDLHLESLTQLGLPAPRSRHRLVVEPV